ncbi:hypothetical protein ABT336_24255 [Micromonospora sp. NPDC000207]|uniref:hypothetical protein n=1 Tax=Micromonospora sp. NPDC000207 TaxID=3154246 RepID=UPI00332672D6
MNREAYVTRTHAAAAAGVAPRTLEGWRRRGWKTPDGERRRLTTKQSRTHAGHVTYLLGDVLDAARDTALNPKNPGRESRVLVLG